MPDKITLEQARDIAARGQGAGLDFGATWHSTYSGWGVTTGDLFRALFARTADLLVRIAEQETKIAELEARLKKLEGGDDA